MEDINRKIIESQPRKHPSARKDNLSDETRRLIKEKSQINPITEHRKWKRIQKKIKKQREEDKVEWINDLVNNSKNTKDLFAGINEIGRTYQPKRYTRRDIRGKIVDLKDRAVATKEYLENTLGEAGKNKKRPNKQNRERSWKNKSQKY